MRSLFLTAAAAFLILASDPSTLIGQTLPDRPQFSTGIAATLSDGWRQPHWLTANRWGLLDEESGNALFYGSVYRAPGTERFFNVGGGASLVARYASNQTIHFNEAWLEIRHEALAFRVGRVREVRGEAYQPLTSGSLIESGNATPISRVTLSLDDYLTIPGSGGWLEARGHISHGWFTGERAGLDIPTDSPVRIRDTWLHEKSLYLQTGGESGHKLYIGLIHASEWAGRLDTGRELPSSFRDLFRVMVAASGGSDSPGIDRVNALGSHTGVWDFGFRTEIGNSPVHLYHQHLFSDGSGLLFRNAVDGLYGLAVENPFGGSLVTALLWEVLSTRHQTGPGMTDPMDGDSPSFCEEVNCGYRFNGRDDYYNNDFYLSGWSHHGRGVGSPLFLTRRQLLASHPGTELYSDRFFASTRVEANHAGITGMLAPGLNYTLRATRARHHGTYWGKNLGEPWGSLDPDLDQESYFFNPSLVQWYWMAEASWRLPSMPSLMLQAALAVDRGELFQSTGVMVGIEIRPGRP